jgi:purine-nucleoside phosphorylase
MFDISHYLQAKNYINEILPRIPKIAITLGSGIQGFTKLIENKIVINYSDIPHFPLPTIKEHEGKIIFGQINGTDILVMSGRSHYYEGFIPQESTFYVRVLRELGVKNLILTNSCASMKEDIEPGTFMLIKDHISLFSPQPLRGVNIDYFGSRFLDMTDVYSSSWRASTMELAKSNNIKLVEGVYVMMSGPNFETAAEVNMLKNFADIVGMSTVPEAITGLHCGIKIQALSMITNYATGMNNPPPKLDQDFIMARARAYIEDFSKLLVMIIEKDN